MPLTAAQSTASHRSTSGSAGLAGGFLPVAVCHALVRLLRATVAPNSAAASEKIDQTFELSFGSSFDLSLAMSCLSVMLSCGCRG